MAILDHKVKTLEGKEQSLADYKGKVVLIVNVASQCGFAPQMKPLEELYEKHKDKGFEILGFPSNSFDQEPLPDEKISDWCETTYGATFPVFARVSVKGDDIHPLYKELTATEPFVGDVLWNFQKYLIDRNGNVAARFSPRRPPDDPEVVAKIEEVIKQ